MPAHSPRAPGHQSSTHDTHTHKHINHPQACPYVCPHTHRGHRVTKAVEEQGQDVDDVPAHTKQGARALPHAHQAPFTTAHWARESAAGKPTLLQACPSLKATSGSPELVSVSFVRA